MRCCTRSRTTPRWKNSSRPSSCRSTRSTSARWPRSSMPQVTTQQYAKGAPQVIAALAKLDPATLARYQATVNELAAHGYRALGVAKSDDAKSGDAEAGSFWASSRSATRRARTPRRRSRETERLGLNVKMVTGDDVAIGDQIAKQLGMGDHLLVASDVFKDGTTPATHPARRRHRGRARRRLRPGVPAAQIRDRQERCSSAATSSR